MKHIYLLLLTLLLCSFSTKIQPTKLPNGTYRVVFDKQFEDYQPFILIIKGNSAESIHADKHSTYFVKWIEKDRFRLIAKESNIDSISPIQKKLQSLSDPFYEITHQADGSISFTFSQNMHIVINSGNLIQQQ